MVPERDASNEQKNDKDAAERRIQNWLGNMKRVLNRKRFPRTQAEIGRLSRISSKKGRAPPITAGLASNQDEQMEGVEASQKTYAVETTEILQQIEKL